MARGATLRIFIVVCGLFGFGVAIGGPASAADERERLEDPFEITADRIDYDGSKDLYVATGRVRVIQTGRRLRARWVAFSDETQIGVAQGDVELVDGGDVLRAEFMVFDVQSLEGMLFEAGLDAGSQGFRVRAEELIRTGENTFTARDGIFSTCRCAPGKRLPWQIRAGRADVELGGYGTVRNSTFDVLGVPVLWIPWAFFPVKSERETGFLLPDFQLGGRGGIGFGLPFFWAAHPQLNVTATPRFMSRRGYKQDLELEYVFGERSEGDLFVAGMRDDFEEPSGGIREARWAVLWAHDQDLPLAWRWQTDLNVVSDNFYPEDFAELRPYKEFRFLESTTSVARDFGATGGLGAMVGARYADDQQGARRGTDFEDTDDFLLQRWVEARADVQPGAAVGPLGVELRVDSELIYFGTRRRHEEVFDAQPPLLVESDGRFYDYGFDATFQGLDQGGENDGLFQPGEPLANRGTRVVLHPRLARTFRLGSLVELVPEVGWNQTLYRSDDQRFAERGLLTGRLELRSRLAREYAPSEGHFVRHLIEPRLGWALVSQRRQKRNPLFVPRASSVQSRLRALTLENVTRNPSDRIASANRVVAGISQRFFSRRGSGSARLKADVLTAVDWNFSRGGLGHVFAEARLFSIGPFNARLRGAFDPEAVAVDEGQVEFNTSYRFENPIVRAIRINTGYRYLRRIPDFLETNRGFSQARRSDTQINQLRFNGRVEITDHFRFGYSTIYSLAGGKDGGTIKNEGSIEYASRCRCWGVGLTIFEERRAGIGGGIQIRFLGLGDGEGSLFDGGFGTRINAF